MTDIKEAFLVWDKGHMDHGDSPELMGVFATVDDAIDYAKNAFESDAWDEALIENWLCGTDHPQAQYTLAENQEA